MTRSTKFFATTSILVMGIGLLFVGCCDGLWSRSPGEPNLVISGIVTDAATGKGVARARVADHLYCGSTRRPCQEAWTDKEGRYELNTWYEEHTLVVSAPGYPPKLVGFATKILSHETEVKMNVSIVKGVN